MDTEYNGRALSATHKMMLPGLPLSSINAVLILRSSSLSLLYKAHGGKPPSILTFLRIVKLALAMLSQHLRGKGNEDRVYFGPDSEVVKPFSDTAAPKA